MVLDVKLPAFCFMAMAHNGAMLRTGCIGYKKRNCTAKQALHMEKLLKFSKAQTKVTPAMIQIVLSAQILKQKKKHCNEMCYMNMKNDMAYCFQNSTKKLVLLFLKRRRQRK